jgi:hypothetical protein
MGIYYVRLTQGLTPLCTPFSGKAVASAPMNDAVAPVSASAVAATFRTVVCNKMHLATLWEGAATPANVSGSLVVESVVLELRSQCSSMAVAVSLAATVSVTVTGLCALQAASHPPLAAEPRTAVVLWGPPVGLPPGQLLAARSTAWWKVCHVVGPWTVLVVMPLQHR